jgi:hypothetical protein
VLGGLQGDVHTRHATHLARPHTGAEDHDLRTHLARGRAHSDGAPALAQDGSHGSVLEDLSAAHACALGECLRHVGGIDASVVGKIEGGSQILHLSEGP